MRMLLPKASKVSLTRWPMAFAISLVTPSNSMCRLLQKGLYGKGIASTKIDEPPIFILGHWRSGTTYLHELMILDDRLTYPTTFQCCAPLQTLVTERLFTRFGNFLVPSKRPMDNMKSGWERPQEDEFALLALGLPSPYRRLAFPNEPAPDMDWLSLDGVDESQLREWNEQLEWFVKLLTYRDGKRVVLKSPPHTGRLGHLSQLFPGAKFVHLVRNPYEIFPSTQRLWQSLDMIQGFQVPHYRNLDEFIYTAFEKMYEGFDRQRSKVPNQHIIDVRYEDLAADPHATMKRIYEQLDIGDFDQVSPKIVANQKETKDYKRNEHQLDDSTRSQIAERWSNYFDRFGYEK